MRTDPSWLGIRPGQFASGLRLKTPQDRPREPGPGAGSTIMQPKVFEAYFVFELMRVEAVASQVMSGIARSSKFTAELTIKIDQTSDASPVALECILLGLGSGLRSFRAPGASGLGPSVPELGRRKVEWLIGGETRPAWGGHLQDCQVTSDPLA